MALHTRVRIVAAYYRGHVGKVTEREGTSCKVVFVANGHWAYGWFETTELVAV